MTDKELETIHKLIEASEMEGRGDDLKELIDMREKVLDLIEAMILNFSIR
jgi:hypothetical protein